jgi:hypothetical protein
LSNRNQRWIVCKRPHIEHFCTASNYFAL